MTANRRSGRRWSSPHAALPCSGANVLEAWSNASGRCPPLPVWIPA